MSSAIMNKRERVGAAVEKSLKMNSFSAKSARKQGLLLLG
jgi:hypothetical protein